MVLIENILLDIINNNKDYESFFLSVNYSDLEKLRSYTNAEMIYGFLGLAVKKKNKNLFICLIRNKFNPHLNNESLFKLLVLRKEFDYLDLLFKEDLYDFNVNNQEVFRSLIKFDDVDSVRYLYKNRKKNLKYNYKKDGFWVDLNNEYLLLLITEGAVRITKELNDIGVCFNSELLISIFTVNKCNDFMFIFNERLSELVRDDNYQYILECIDSLKISSVNLKAILYKLDEVLGGTKNLIFNENNLLLCKDNSKLKSLIEFELLSKRTSASSLF